MKNKWRIRSILSIITSITMFFSVFQPTLAQSIQSFPSSTPVLEANAYNTRIVLNWETVKEAIEYDLEVDGNIISNGQNTSYVHENLLSGSIHTYRLMAKYKNGAGEWGSLLRVKTQSTTPNVPSDFKVTYVTNSSVDLMWSASQYANSYEIEVDGKVVSTLKTSYCLKKLAPSSKHTFRVRAKNETEVSNWTNEYEVTTYPDLLPSPKNLKITSIKKGYITINWDKVSGTDKYEVLSDNKLICNIRDNMLAQMITESAKRHAYFVRAVNKSGKSEWSKGVGFIYPVQKSPEIKKPVASQTDAQKLSIPAGIKTNPSTDSITVTWNPVSNAMNYDLEVDGHIISNITEKRYVLSNISQGTVHTFRVRAKNRNEISDWSSLYNAKTVLEAPVVPANLNANSVSSDCIVAAWDIVNGATGYDLDVDGKIIDVGTNMKYVHTQLMQGSDHTYRVRAKNAAGASNWSETVSTATLSEKTSMKVSSNQIIETHTMPSAYTITAETLNTETDIQAPIAPGNLTASSITSTSVSLSWTASSDDVGVTEYDIYNETQLIGTTAGETTYTITELTPGTSYSYTVKAKDAAGNVSVPSNSVSVTTGTGMMVPTNISAIPTSSSINLSWDTVTDATGYDIEADGIVIDNGASTTYTNTGLTSNSQHSYRVRAKNDTNTSEWSSLLTVTTLLSAPANINAVPTLDSITITWNAVTGAAGYDIEADGIVIDNGSSTTYTHTGLTLNSQHSYRVRAKNDSGSGEWSSLLTIKTLVTIPDVPANINTIPGVCKVTITWDAVTYADGYDVEVNGTIIDNGANTSYTQTGLVPSEQVNFRVRSKNNAGISDWSNLVTEVTSPFPLETPINLSGAATDSSIGIIWTSVDGAEAYEVDADGIVIDNEFNISYVQNGLTKGEVHNYRVRAKSKNGVSDWSKYISISADLTTTSINVNTVLDTNNIYGNLNITGGTYDINRHNVIVLGSLSQTGGTLFINGGLINITSDYSFYNNTYLKMTNESDYVQVDGNFMIQSYNNHTGYLTAGVLEVKGNFTQKTIMLNDNFAASGSHKVILSGNGVQTVSFDSAGSSNFNILELNNTNILFNSPVAINTLVGIGNINSSLTLVNMVTPLTNDYIINGDLNINGGTINLNGHRIEVRGNLVQTGGTLFINGGQMSITSDYSIYNNTYLKMINENDYIQVDGNFLMQSYNNHTGNLMAGVLEVKGNFTQKTVMLNDNFAASGNHKVILSGNGVQTVSFQNPGPSNFNILEINNIDIIFSSSETINTLMGIGYINSSLTLINKTTILNNDFIINGNLNIYSNNINLNGHKLEVTGSYSIFNQAYLKMINNNDYVQVDGNFLMQSYNNHTGYLTAGVLEVKGNFTQKLNIYQSNFATSGSHKVILSGNGVQIVSFDSSGPSNFNILELNNTDILFSSPVAINTLTGIGYINSSLTLVNMVTPLANDYIINGDLNINGGTINLNGHRIEIRGNLVQTGGTLFINGGQIIISSDYSINDNAYLKMINENDYVQVDGNFLMQSYNNHTGYLTAGVLEVNGNFTQKTSIWNSNFAASGNHIVILSGKGVQAVSFQNPGSSKFNILVINKPLSSYTFNTMPIWNLLYEDYSYQTHMGEESSDSPSLSGNYCKTFTDMSISSPGFTLDFTRTYNSKDTRDDSPLGRGWTFGFEGSIKDYGNNVPLKLVKLPNGSIQYFHVNSDGTFTADGTRSALVKQADGSYILTTKDQYSYGFNSDGYLIWMMDKIGNTVNITVNSSGRVTGVTDAVGRHVTIAYNGDNLIQSITDTENRTVTYEYNNGQLYKVYDPMGYVTIYSYDSSGFLIEIRANDSSLIESITYNHATGINQDKIDHTIDANGNIFTYNYDNLLRKTTITDSNGKSVIYTYDGAMYVISTIDYEGKVNSTTYFTDSNNVNKYGEEKTVIDRNGGMTQYERDANGNITKVTNPDGSYTIYTYDDKNNCISERDESGKYIYYIFDSDNKLMIKKAQPLNGTDVYNLGCNESNFSVTNYIYYTDSEAQSLGYTAKGLLKQIINPEGITTTYTYDLYGNIHTVTDGENNTTTYEYNSIGWKIETISPMGYVTEYFYDNNGNIEKTILNNNIVTRTVYDTLGRKVKIISANLYDASQDDILNHDYNDNCGTRYTYYPSGKVKTVIDNENNTTSYTYDIYGNMLSETKPNGARYRYEYDVMNRVLKIYFKENVNAQEILLQENSYTILGGGNTQKTQTVYFNSTDSAQTISTYDYAGSLIIQLNPDGTSISRVYNANGTLNSITDENGNITYYTYDGLNRLIGIWSPIEDINGTIYYSYNGIEYDKAGRKIREIIGKDKVTKYTIPATNCITTSYEYYNDDKLKIQSDSSGKSVDYTYDNDGNVIMQVVKVDESTNRITEYVNNEFGKPVTIKIHAAKGDIYGNDFSNTADAVLTTVYTYDKEGNILTVTTPDGVTKTYIYDKLGRLISTSEPGVDEYGNNVTIVTSQTYNWEGKIITKTDADGNVTSYTYDARGTLIKVTDAKGNITACYYDYAGRKTAEVSANNYDETKELSALNRTEYVYDLMGRVKAELVIYFDTVSSTWVTITSKAFQYDSCGNVIKELDAGGYNSGSGTSLDQKISSGYGTIYTYNFTGNVVTILDPDSKDRYLPYSIKYTYDGAGRKITETDAKGKVTTYYYDDAGNIIMTTIKRLSTESEVTISSSNFNLTGEAISYTDGNGYITIYEYNAFGKIKKVTYPGDSTIDAYYIIFQYDTLGHLIKKQDSLGVTDLYTYDNQGREISHIQEKSDGTEAIITAANYDLNGNKRFTTDGNGVVTENTYNAINKLITSSVYVTNSLGQLVNHATTYSYDKDGNLIAVTDWLGNTKTNVYDPLDRLIRKIDENGKIIQILEYNANSTQSKSWDTLGNLTQYFYDKNNRLIKTIDQEGHIILQHYDEAGNIDQKTDGNNNTTYYTYDQYNRLVAVKNAKDEITNYSYDLNGNMLIQTDAMGYTTTFEYNSANKMVRKINDGGRTETPENYSYDSSKTENYTYYGDSSLKSKTDRDSKTFTYVYDIHGRMVSETAGNMTISYTYDNNGNVLTMTDSTGTTARTYDELNRAVSKTVPNIGTTDYCYDIISGIEGLDTGYYAESTTDPKENMTVKIYDKTGRIIKVTADGNAIVYNYYDNGSLQSIIYPNGYSEVYEYYKDSLLKKLTNKKSDDTALETYIYTYDGAHNMLSKVDGKGTTAYTYDQVDRLITITEPGSKVTSYTYTAAGNRETETVTEGTNITVKTYTYDSQNRLQSTTIQLNGITAQETLYTYDNNGNELTESSTAYVDGTAQTPEVTSNVYDDLNQLTETTIPDGTSIINIYNGEGIRVEKHVGSNIIRYLYEGDKVILELDGAGNQSARNVYGTNLLSRYTDGITAYYLYNGHGDVTRLISSSGEDLATYYYDEFGNITEETGAIDNPFRYSGYQYDKETNTYYLIARMYDPETGRFLQEDTYSGDMKDPLSLNLYTYCHNEPLMYTDPTGHMFESLKNAWNSFTSGVKEVFSGIKETASNLWEGVKSTAGKIGNTIKSGISSLKKASSKVLSEVREDSKYIREGFVNHFKNRYKSIVNTIKSIKNNPKGFATNALNSTLFAVNHPYITMGIYASGMLQQGKKDVTTLIWGTKKQRFNLAGDILGSGAEYGATALAVGAIGKAAEGIGGTMGKAADGIGGGLAEETENVHKMNLQLFADEGTAEARLIPGEEGIVTGGNSTKLGKNMLESMGLNRSTKWSVYQAQHVIPAEMGDNAVIQKIGMNLDDASNGIFLRTPDEGISTMSRHQGYHSVYNEVVERQLNKMDVNQSVGALQKQVYDLQQNLRYLQEQGLPLYPSQGSTVDLWERQLSKLK